MYPPRESKHVTEEEQYECPHHCVHLVNSSLELKEVQGHGGHCCVNHVTSMSYCYNMFIYAVFTGAFVHKYVAPLLRNGL